MRPQGDKGSQPLHVMVSVVYLLPDPCRVTAETCKHCGSQCARVQWLHCLTDVTCAPFSVPSVQCLFSLAFIVLNFFISLQWVQWDTLYCVSLSCMLPFPNLNGVCTVNLGRMNVFDKFFGNNFNLIFLFLCSPIFTKSSSQVGRHK